MFILPNFSLPNLASQSTVVIALARWLFKANRAGLPGIVASPLQIGSLIHRRSVERFVQIATLSQLRDESAFRSPPGVKNESFFTNLR